MNRARQSGEFPDYPAFRREPPRPSTNARRSKETVTMAMPGRNANGTFKKGRSAAHKRSASHGRSASSHRSTRKAAPSRGARARGRA